MRIWPVMPPVQPVGATVSHVTCGELMVMPQLAIFTEAFEATVQPVAVMPVPPLSWMPVCAASSAMMHPGVGSADASMAV
ncbi:hypothetical protein D3C83_143480 [compost metagenome]